MPHDESQRRQPRRYVAAGVVYLLLSAILFVLWLRLGTALLLVLALSTVVAGLVDLSVGWPRLRHRPSAQTRPR